jgi:hypothetical protein
MRKGQAAPKFLLWQAALEGTKFATFAGRQYACKQRQGMEEMRGRRRGGMETVELCFDRQVLTVALSVTRHAEDRSRGRGEGGIKGEWGRWGTRGVRKWITRLRI